MTDADLSIPFRTVGIPRRNGIPWGMAIESIRSSTVTMGRTFANPLKKTPAGLWSKNFRAAGSVFTRSIKEAGKHGHCCPGKLSDADSMSARAGVGSLFTKEAEATIHPHGRWSIAVESHAIEALSTTANASQHCIQVAVAKRKIKAAHNSFSSQKSSFRWVSRTRQAGLVRAGRRVRIVPPDGS